MQIVKKGRSETAECEVRACKQEEEEAASSFLRRFSSRGMSHFGLEAASLRMFIKMYHCCQGQSAIRGRFLLSMATVSTRHTQRTRGRVDFGFDFCLAPKEVNLKASNMLDFVRSSSWHLLPQRRIQP